MSENIRITRRAFVKDSAAMLLTGIGLASQSGCSSLFQDPPMKPIPSSHDYFTLFHTDPKMIQTVISEALHGGGDYGDVFFQHRLTTYINLEDHVVNQASCNTEYGVGIRVTQADQTGYAYSESMNLGDILNAARTAAQIASSSGNSGPMPLQEQRIPCYYPVQKPWDHVPVDQIISCANKLDSFVFSQDHRVIKCQVSLRYVSERVLIANSLGNLVWDDRPLCVIFANCTAEQNGRREENYAHRTARQGFEFLTDQVFRQIADEAVQRTVRLFDAVKSPGGEMEVVLASGNSGILLHEAIGHGMEADFNRKNTSIYSGQIGQKIAPDFVSIVDDAACPAASGALNVDDEANPTECTTLVEDGILRSYLYDRISARHYQVQSTGNGRRQSYRFPPMPRMRSTYMKPGRCKPEEILQSVKNGIYAEQFTNGEVNIGGGDFTFYMKSGWRIENGKLTQPVKDVNLIGNGPEVLRRITMVADDLQINPGGGTCGKNGQWVSVSFGMPTAKVSQITVGGA